MATLARATLGWLVLCVACTSAAKSPVVSERERRSGSCGAEVPYDKLRSPEAVRFLGYAPSDEHEWGQFADGRAAVEIAFDGGRAARVAVELNGGMFRGEQPASAASSCADGWSVTTVPLSPDGDAQPGLPKWTAPGSAKVAHRWEGTTLMIRVDDGEPVRAVCDWAP